MFDEPIPSKSDLALLKKLDIQGDDILKELRSLFSHHRPKEYKIYVENIQYNPLDKDKIILDLIFTIHKYNNLVKKEMEIYHKKGKTNKYFSDLYKGSKYFGKSVTSKTCGEILNNLIPKYSEKHMRFKNDFLKKNIFHKSGLLPNTLAQTVEFFDDDVRENGVNSYKSFKYMNFIEKLYKQVQKIFQRQTINSTLSIYQNQQERIYQMKKEKIMKAKMEKIRRKEIKLEQKEIEKLQKLMDIANETYQKIMESINKRKTPKRQKSPKKKTRIKIKGVNKEENTSKESEKIKGKDDNSNNVIINSVANEKQEEKNTESKLNTLNTKYNETHNGTLSVERGTTMTFFNNRATATTGFIDSKNNTLSHFNLYNIQKDLINKLNNLKQKKEKEKEQNFFKHLPINQRTLSRNNSNKQKFPEIFNKGIKEQEKNIKLLINPVLNSTTNNFQMLKSNESAPLLLNMDSNNPKSSDDKNRVQNEPKLKKILKNKKVDKKSRRSKLDLLYEQRKKIPIIYEQLRKIRNLLNMSRKDTAQKSKVFELYTDLYGKKKVSNVDEKKVPKELYNTYYNMRVNIENKNRNSNIFKKYKIILDKNLEENLIKSKEQDEKLKSKYYDLVQVMIKKQLEGENEKFLKNI